MNVLEAVRTRRSIRSFDDKLVEKDKLLKILEAARLSPSANNNQPSQFIIVSDKTIRESLLPAYAHQWFIKAPVIIVACSLPSNAWARQDGETYWKVDIAIAVQNMILVAHDLGLGTCWVAAFEEDEVKKVLDIPKGVRVIAMIPIGYPAEQKLSVIERKSLEEIIHYEHW
ncbi:MAG TPA: nitroreductase family protein [Candidatus Sulfotelmatobacter sp.]|nr:nitroreductase family protein [Candidatus Sulfotelmatobacter sp.]